jgi:uncharacterized protein (TIGR02996 family)
MASSQMTQNTTPDYSDHPLYQHIVSDPLDLDARLVFADWLEEQGDQRSKLIRIQHQLTQPSESAEWRKVLEDEARVLFEQHGGFGGREDSNYLDFYVGFLDRLSVPTNEFLERSSEIMATPAFRQLTLTRVAKKMERLATIPELSRLRSLTLRSTLIDGHPFELLVNSSNLDNLRQLSVLPDCGDDIAPALASSPVINTLTELTLEGKLVRSDSVQHIARTPSNLTTLNMGRSVRDEALDLIADSDHLRSLRHLDIIGGLFPEASLRRLGSSRFDILFETMRISVERGTPLSAYAYPRFGNLHSLHRTHGPAFLSADEIREIATMLPFLRELDVNTDGAGIREMAKSSPLANAISIGLIAERTLPSDIVALLDSEYLSLNINIVMMIDGRQADSLTPLQDRLTSLYSDEQNAGGFRILDRESGVVIVQSHDDDHFPEHSPHFYR